VTQSGKPEYGIVLAIVGILLAIGASSIARGEGVRGWTLLGAAAAVLAWVAITAWRHR
jgi:hypothetical protein